MKHSKNHQAQPHHHQYLEFQLAQPQPHHQINKKSKSYEVISNTQHVAVNHQSLVVAVIVQSHGDIHVTNHVCDTVAIDVLLLVHITSFIAASLGFIVAVNWAVAHTVSNHILFLSNVIHVTGVYVILHVFEYHLHVAVIVQFHGYTHVTNQFWSTIAIDVSLLVHVTSHVIHIFVGVIWLVHHIVSNSILSLSIYNQYNILNVSFDVNLWII